MGKSVTQIFYLGMEEVGANRAKLIASEARKRGLSVSKFIMYCIAQVITKEKKKYEKPINGNVDIGL